MSKKPRAATNPSWLHGPATSKDGLIRSFAALQSQTKMAGAIALAVYSVVVCHLLVRARLRALPATLLSLVVWLFVAFGLFAFA